MKITKFIQNIFHCIFKISRKLTTPKHAKVPMYSKIPTNSKVQNHSKIPVNSKVPNHSRIPTNSKVQDHSKFKKIQEKLRHEKNKTYPYTVKKKEATVSELITEYIDNRINVLSPSSIRSYRQLANGYIKNTSISEIPFDELTCDDLQKFINEFSKTHSPKTTKSTYSLVHSALSTYDHSRQFFVTLPPLIPPKRNIPTDDDVSLLINNSSGDLKKAIMLAAFGTLRRGECCALNYEDISGNIIHVHADTVLSYTNEWKTKEMPKTMSSDRYIPLPDFVIKELGSGTGRIIKSSPNILSHKFVRLRESLGLSFRFHDLRHYAASIMHAIGIPDQYIMERGGWSSDAVLKSVYRNVLSDKENEFSKKTNDYLAEKFG